MNLLRKVGNAIIHPRRALNWAIVRYVRVRDKLRTPLYERRRQALLRQASNSWQVVYSSGQNMKDMEFDVLTSCLQREEKKLVDWTLLTKQHATRSSNTKVSIVVLVLNNTHMTLRCLDSIFRADTTVEYEVIVVDNGSHYPTVKALTQYKLQHPEIKLVLIDQNLNFSLGNNIGFRAASGDVCVFLNNDTYVTDGWLDQLTRPLRTKSIGAVQPLLLYPDDTVQCAGIVFSNKSPLGYGIYVGKPARSRLVKKSRKMQAVTGACLAIRSKDFAVLHGFDVNFVNGQEDVDLCLRLLETGRYTSNYVEVGAKVYHDESRTPGRGKRVAFNREVFVRRWAGRIKPDDERLYKSDGYRVKKWTVDREEYRQRGIEVYLPTLEKV